MDNSFAYQHEAPTLTDLFPSMDINNDQSIKSLTLTSEEINNSTWIQEQLPVYRNVEISNSFPELNVYQRKSQLKPYKSNQKNIELSTSQIPNELHSNYKGIQVSCSGDQRLHEPPMCLLPTHVVVSKPLAFIETTITNVLNHISYVNYEFNANMNRWEGVCDSSYCFCKFEIDIYTSSNSNEWIVECICLYGDYGFQRLFSRIKSALNDTMDDVSNDHDIQHSLMHDVVVPLFLDMSDEDVLKTLQPIIEMATDPSIEVQFETSKILLDLSCNDAIHQEVCYVGLITSLANMQRSDCLFTQRNSILALANFSESQSCQDEIMNSGVIPRLLTMIQDGSYLTAETRRGAARIVANICTRLAHRIINEIDRESLLKWLDSIADIQDKKLKIHAERAKSRISKLLT